MLQHWIWLSTRKSLSDKWKVSLLEHFHDPEQIYFAGGQDFSFVDFLTAEEASPQFNFTSEVKLK